MGVLLEQEIEVSHARRREFWGPRRAWLAPRNRLMMLRIPAFRHALVEVAVPSGPRPESRPPGGSPDAAPGRRFAFARRWERKKKVRSTRRAWLVILVDLLLLALISAMGLVLVQRLT